MTLKERYSMAEYSNHTAATRLGAIITIIILFITPGLLFPNFLDVGLSPIFNNIITGLSVWILGLIVIVSAWLLISLVVAMVAWVVTGDFEDWFGRLWSLPTEGFDFLGNLFLMVFGSYRGKWTFLREWFQSNKVAKDILEEK